MESELKEALQTSRFEFMPAANYAEWLVEHIDQASERVVLQTMALAYDSKTAPIFEALANAARRGVPTYLVADAYIRQFDDGRHRFGPSFSQGKQARANLRVLKGALKGLQTAGVNVQVIHPYMGRRRKTLNPWAGRNHCKHSEIDDYVAVGGGINLTQAGFKNHDYMLVTNNHELAKFLADYALELLPDGHGLNGETSRSFTINEHTTLIIDEGYKGRSDIYDLAVYLAAQAREVLFTSQMRPGKRLRQALHKVATKWGKDSIKAYHNHPSSFGFPANLEQYVEHLLEYQVEYRVVDGYLHAKFVIMTLPDGTEVAITGTHNLSQREVDFGTAEMALVTTDPVIIASLKAFVARLPAQKLLPPGSEFC